MAAARITRAKYGISWYFFNLGLLVGNYVSRIPSIKEDNDLSDGVLGVVLFCTAIGSLACLPVVAKFNNMVGSGFSTFAASIATAAVCPIIGITTGGLSALFMGMFAIGFGMGFADVSANAQAVIAEKLAGTPQMGIT